MTIELFENQQSFPLTTLIVIVQDTVAVTFYGDRQTVARAIQIHPA